MRVALKPEFDLFVWGLKMGYGSVYVPKSKIWHKVSISSANIIKAYYLTRNRFWFMRTHASRAQLAFFLSYYFSYKPWRDIWFFVRGKDFRNLPPFFKGMLDGLVR
jgi:hypothetical protein